MLTAKQYEELKQRYDKYDSWRKSYIAEHGNGIPLSDIPESLRVTNDEISKLEVYEFCNDVPDSYFLYVSENRKQKVVHPEWIEKYGKDYYQTWQHVVTTWTGDILGKCLLGSPYYSNFGDKRQSITVWGLNGVVYYGTYFTGAGNYARIRKAKKQFELEWIKAVTFVN